MEKVFKLRNGAIALCAEAPGGIYNAAQLKAIASICEGQAALVRSTEDQRITLFVQEEQLADVISRLNAAGLSARHYQKGLHQPVTCFGSLCPEHQQDALGTAVELTSTLASVSLDSSLKIGVNGCPTCCVPTHTMDISILADQEGYRVNIGGKNSYLPEMAPFMAEGIPADEVVNLVKKVVEIYKTNVQDEETLQQVMERIGATPFIKALEPYSNDAAAASDLGLGIAEPEKSPIGDSSETSISDENFKEEPTLEPEMMDEPVNKEDEVLIQDLEQGENELKEIGDIEIDPNGFSEEMRPEQLNGDVFIEKEPVAQLVEEPTIEAIDSRGENLFDPLMDPLEIPDEQSTSNAAAQAEGDNEEEIAFEEKLAASIAEEESVAATEDDTYSVDRLETLKIVESSPDTAESSFKKELESFDDLDDLEEEYEMLDVAGMSEKPISGGMEAVESPAEMTLDFENSEDLKMLAEDGIIPTPGKQETQKEAYAAKPETLDKSRVAAVRSISQKPSAKSENWEFAGLNLLSSHEICLQFSSGAEVTIDVNKLKASPEGFCINFGGHTVTLRSDEGDKVQVETDGINLTLPVQAA